MKILWCHEVSYIDKPVYEYQDLAERLAARGHKVHVVDFSEQQASDGSLKTVSRTGEGNVSLSSIKHSNRPFIKFIEAKWNYHRFLKQKLRNNDYDVAVIYSVFVNGTQTVRLCRKHGIPTINRVLDAYHRLRDGKLGQKILKDGERFLYRNSDKVLTTNAEMANYVTDLAELAPSDPRVEVLGHGVDTMHFAKRQRDNVLAQKFGIEKDDIVAIFLGTTYEFSGLLELIPHISDVLKLEPNFKLLIVGGGAHDEAIREEVRRCHLGNTVIQAGWANYDELPGFMSLADISLTPFHINAITADIIPIKVLQYLASGLPMVGTPLPDVVEHFPANDTGNIYSVDDSARSYLVALTQMLSRSDEWQARADIGRNFVISHFSVNAMVDKLEQILEQSVEAISRA